MSKTTRYIPLSPQQLELYRNKKRIEETGREDKTNNTLIALRRSNLNVINANPLLKTKLKNFNSYVARRKHEDILKVFNFLLSELYNES